MRPFRTVRASLLALAALALSAPAEGRVRFTTPGAYRLRATGIGDVPLDEAGTGSGQRLVGQHRLRIDPTLEVGLLTVRIQLDVLTGQIFGDPNPVGADFVERRDGNPERSDSGWTTVEPRMLWAEVRLPGVVLRAGQMGDEWGMGLLAEDGDTPADEADRWVERFGDRWGGDLVDRVLVTTTPLAPFTHGDLGELQLAVGADFVYQDDEASFLDGDEAYRLLASMLYPGEELWFGAYVVHRDQTDHDGDETSVTSFDTYGRWLLPLYTWGADLRVQAEAVVQLGETTRAGPRAVDVRGYGWSARGDLAWRCPRVATALEVGYASGDAEPEDGELSDFTFDPDHRVGFILFPDVLRLVGLRGADRLDEAGGQGAELLPTDGAVRNAIYFFPGVTWRPGPWRVTAAGLLAWAAEPFLDPFATAASGSARNHRGAPAARFYGYELDAGLHRGFAVPLLGPGEIGVQGGVFVPGEALEGADASDPVGKVMGRLDLRW